MTRPALPRIRRPNRALRVFRLSLGVTAMLAAPIVGIPAPGPLGTFIFAFGLALVLRNSPWARRRYVRHIRRFPRLERIVNFGLRRKARRRPAAPSRRSGHPGVALASAPAPAELTNPAPPPTSLGLAAGDPSCAHRNA